MAIRPTPDQVLSLAPDPGAASAAVLLAVPAAWSAAGCDDAAVWGAYIAASAEPYDVAVDLSDDVAGPAYRCNCPSRKVPCKHALGLLLLHATGAVGPARRLPFADDWLQRRAARMRGVQEAERSSPDPSTPDASTVASADGGEQAMGGEALGGRARPPATGLGEIDPQRQKRQIERGERMRAGLRELDRWLADRIRVGLSASELGDIETWDRLAARLVDAQCGALANRVRRVASKVGQHPRWHEDVLEEMALLHALAVGAQHTSSLVADLADGVHAATGLTVARDDVLASVASTASWIVAGESRAREDRITVQRTWLASAGAAPVTWAMVLAFGAFDHEVSTEHSVGTAIDADLHWYPGGVALRAIVGRVHSDPLPLTSGPASVTIADSLSAAGWALAGEPWLERFPMCISAVPVPIGNGRWVMRTRPGRCLLQARSRVWPRSSPYPAAIRCR